jgi:transposase InsO family protein
MDGLLLKCLGLE